MPPDDPQYTALERLWWWGGDLHARVLRWWATLGNLPPRTWQPEPVTCECAGWVTLAAELARAREAAGIVWRCEAHGWQEIRFQPEDAKKMSATESSGA